MFEFLTKASLYSKSHIGNDRLKPADLIRAMNSENSARFIKLWERIDKMTEAEFNIQFAPDGRSVSHHLQLVIAEYERWIDYLDGDVDALYLEHDLTDDLTKAELERYWNSAQQSFSNFFYRQSRERLHLTLAEINGPMWEALIHLLIRAEEHHKYILTILANLGHAPELKRSNRDLWQFRPEPMPILEPSEIRAH